MNGAQNMKHDVGFGAIGTGGPVVGLIVSAMPEIEAWLRILSLLVGIAVGLFSLWRLVKARKNDDLDGSH